jgi:V/A-type H+-transporting ATPase subunit K
MDDGLMFQFRDLGFSLCLTLSAIGSAFGTGVAGMAAIGAWKKCFAQNKKAPFILTVFVGAPLSQTIYGMIVMNALIKLAVKGQYMWSTGILCGLAMGLSSWLMGRAGAAAADAMAESGQGFGNYLMVIGIIETVSLFIMVFFLMAMRAM